MGRECECECECFVPEKERIGVGEISGRDFVRSRYFDQPDGWSCVYVLGGGNEGAYRTDGIGRRNLKILKFELPMFGQHVPGAFSIAL